MTQSISYQAPFKPGGSSEVDAELARKLLTIALSRGGDYADLFFEYRAGGGISFEEGITRSASRGVSMGLGVRVQKGDATGYAHVEDLSWDAMKRAAETAARIAQGGKTISPVAIERLALPARYELDRPSIDVPGVDKRSLLERASKAALAYDPRIIKAEASFAEEVREILIATSDGRMVHDVQPLMRFGIRAVAEQNGRRESGRSSGGGRMTLGYFDGFSPEWHAEVGERRDGHPELAFAAVDHEEVGACPRRVVGFVRLVRAAKPPGQHFVHRGKIVVLDGADLEFAVQAARRNPVDERHHRRDGIGARDVGDIEALDPLRRFRQSQRLLQRLLNRLRVRLHYPESLIIRLFSVVSRQINQGALLPAQRHENMNRCGAAALARELFA